MPISPARAGNDAKEDDEDWLRGLAMQLKKFCF
jgi:hypothetical protein